MFSGGSTFGPVAAVAATEIWNFFFYYPAIDAPGGFLFEWWSVFWDIFIARNNEKHSEVAASYFEVRQNSLCDRICLIFFGSGLDI